MKTLAVMAILIGLLAITHTAHANVYAYMDENGDYVVTKKRPGKSVREYAVLSDDGEFIRLVQPRDLDVPITHWRPWFIPNEPDPYDADPEIFREREGIVEIQE